MKKKFTLTPVIIFLTIHSFLSCKSKKGDIIPVEDKTVYTTTYRGDVYSVNAKTGQHNWDYSTGNYMVSSPIVAGERLYFGDYDGILYALNANTGQEKWSSDLGASIVSSPTVSNNTIYVGTSGIGGGFHAVNATTGKTIWTYPAISSYSTPCVSEGLVYFVSFDNKLYALDATSGELKWKYTSENRLKISPIVNRGILCVIDGYNLTALDAATGQNKWSYKCNFSNWIHSGTPVFKENSVFFLDGERMLTALDLNTGTKKWDHDFKDYINGTPVVLGGKIYVYGKVYLRTDSKSSDGTISSNDQVYRSKLYALDIETGIQTWAYNSKNEFYNRSYMVLPMPSAGTNRIYFNSQDGRIYAVDAETGEENWQFGTGSYIWSTPCILDDEGNVSRGL